MEYQVQIIPIDKAVLDHKGIIDPLCNDCTTPDCSNPIRERNVSVLGNIKKMRLFVINNMCSQVVDCSGYSGPRADISLKNQGSNLNVNQQAEETRIRESQEENPDSY